MNYVYFSELQRAQAFLILHGHTNAHTYGGRLVLDAWRTDLSDSMQVSLHPVDVTFFSNEFRQRFGEGMHPGNFAPILDASEWATLEALQAAGLIAQTNTQTPTT